MKILLLLYVLFVLVALAHAGSVTEGQQCNAKEDCMRNLLCTNNKCSCEEGKRYIDIISDGQGVRANCVDAQGSECKVDSECSVLPNGKCEEGKCNGAASNLASIALSSILVMGLLRVV